MNWSQSLFQKFLSEFRIFLSVAFSVPKVFNICQSLTWSWTLLPEHWKLSLVQVNYQCCSRESNINNQRNKILKRVHYYYFVKSLYEQNFAFCWYFRRDKPRFRNKPIVTLLQWLPSGFRVKQASPYADVLCFFCFFWGFERKERTDGSTEISIAPMAISHFVVLFLVFLCFADLVRFPKFFFEHLYLGIHLIYRYDFLIGCAEYRSNILAMNNSEQCSKKHCTLATLAIIGFNSAVFDFSKTDHPIVVIASQELLPQNNIR